MEKRMLIRNRKYGIAFIFIHIYVHDKYNYCDIMTGHSWSKYDIDSQTFVKHKRNDFKNLETPKYPETLI